MGPRIWPRVCAAAWIFSVTLRLAGIANTASAASRLDLAGLKAASFYPPPKGEGLVCRYVYIATLRRGAGFDYAGNPLPGFFRWRGVLRQTPAPQLGGKHQ